MKKPRAAAIDQLMAFLHKSEANRAMPKQNVPSPAAPQEDISQDALEALQSLTKEG